MYNVVALSFKNNSGDAIKIIVGINSVYNGTPIQLSDVRVKGYRKRSYISIKQKTTVDQLYRGLPLNSVEKRDYLLNKYLEYVTIEEIEKALLNAWERIRPTIDKVKFSLQ